MGQGLREQLLDNPFYVLGVAPQCSRAEMEREGQKLLGMLELGLFGAGTYPTPVGSGRRTADKVRLAMAELRDPEKRLLHELWARGPVPGGVSDDVNVNDDVNDRVPRQPAWEGALSALGFGGRR